MVGLSVRRFPWVLSLVALVVSLAAACAPTARPAEAPLVATGTSVPAGASTPSTTAVTSPTAKPSGAFPLTATDDKGRAVALATRPERIVSLSSGHTEILFAIGAGAQVAAVDKFATYPPETAQKEKLDAYQPNLEAIAAVKPDLVILDYDPSGIVEGLDRLKIPVYFVKTPSSLEGVLQKIGLLGNLTGHPQEAERLVVQLRTRIAAVRETVGKAAIQPRVFHELDPSLYTVSNKSFVGDLYNVLRARNIAAAAVQEYPQITQEVIIQSDPEVIILADEGAGESLATVKARPGWANITAVKNNRVHAVDPDIVSRPGPRVVDGLETLAKLLYPALYADQGPGY